MGTVRQLGEAGGRSCGLLGASPGACTACMAAVVCVRACALSWRRAEGCALVGVGEGLSSEDNSAEGRKGAGYMCMRT